MKYIVKVLFMCALMIFVSCEKEDALEGVYLAPNKYQTSEDRYVTVTNVQQINCTTISFDIVIHKDLLPKEISDNLKEYKVRIEDSFGKLLIATRTIDQWVAARCDEMNEFKIALYRESTGSVSRSYQFTFKTTR